MHNFCAFALDLCDRCAYYYGMSESRQDGQDGQAKEGKDSERAWTDQERACFDALVLGETMDSAARLMGLTYQGLYCRRQTDPQLDAQIKASNVAGRVRQAGRIAKALYAGAEKCGDDPRHTTAAIFALKNLDPQNWRDSHEISGPGGGAIPMQIVMFGTPPDDDTTDTDPGDAATGA